LNSNYGIKFIILSNIFELTQISEGLKPIRKFELNQRKNCEMQLCTMGQITPGPTLCRPVHGRSRGARSPWRTGDALAKSGHDRRRGGRGRRLVHDSEVAPRFWGQRDERSSPDGSSTVVRVGRVGRWWGLPPGGRRRGCWADEVHTDEAKLVAATSGLEGGWKRLAALRCSRWKVDSVGFSVAPSVARPTPWGRPPRRGVEAGLESIDPTHARPNCSSIVARRCAESREAGGVGGGLTLRADTKEEIALWGRGGEASWFGLLNDVSQRIRTWAAYAAVGHRRRMVSIRSVAWVRVRWPVHSVRQWLWLTGRAQLISEFLMIFTHPNFEIRNGDLPDIQNSPNFS
jgi:hypothetical protein